MSERSTSSLATPTPGLIGQHHQKARENSKTRDHQTIAASPIVEPAVSTPNAQSAAKQCTGYDGVKHDCEIVAVQAAVQQTHDVHLQAQLALIGAFIALATLLTAGWAGLWAKRAGKAAENTLEFENRPWLSIELQGEFAELSHDTALIRFSYVEKNIGRSPLRLSGVVRRFRPAPINADQIERMLIPHTDDEFFKAVKERDGGVILPGQSRRSVQEFKSSWSDISLLKHATGEAAVCMFDFNVSYSWSGGNGVGQIGGTWSVFFAENAQLGAGRPPPGATLRAPLTMVETWMTAS